MRQHKHFPRPAEDGVQYCACGAWRKVAQDGPFLLRGAWQNPAWGNQVGITGRYTVCPVGVSPLGEAAKAVQS